MKKIKRLLATDMNPAKTSSPAGVKVYGAAAAAQDWCTERHTTRRAKKRLPGVLNLVHTVIFAAISASAPALAYTIKAAGNGNKSAVVSDADTLSVNTDGNLQAAVTDTADGASITFGLADTVNLGDESELTATQLNAGSSTSYSSLTDKELTLASGVSVSSQGASTPIIGSGNFADVGTTNTVILGTNNQAGIYGYGPSDLVLIGSDLKSTSNESVIINPSGGTYYGNNELVVIGAGASTTGSNAVVIGHGASGADYSAVVGYGASAGISSLAVGSFSTASDSNGAYWATAIGISSHASGANSTAIGYGSGANSELSTAIGYGAASYGKNSFSMGANALTVGEGAIALGANSYANTEAGKIGYDPSGETHTGSAWVSTDGAMSIGNANTGSTRQIQNVAAGTLDTDAVNVAQLKNSSLTFKGDTGSSVVKNGEAVTVQGGAAADAAVTSGNIQVAADEGVLTVSLLQNVNLGTAGSLTIGNVKISGSGINAGGNQITNLGSGVIAEGSKTAVSGGDVYDYLTNTYKGTTTDSSTAVAKIAAGKNAAVSTAEDGTVTVGTTDAATFTSVSADPDQVTAGTVTADQVTVGNTTVSSTGLTTTGTVSAGTVSADSATFGTVTAGNTTVSTSGVTTTGTVSAGTVRTPLDCFVKAFEAAAEKLGIDA